MDKGKMIFFFINIEEEFLEQAQSMSTSDHFLEEVNRHLPGISTIKLELSVDKLTFYSVIIIDFENRKPLMEFLSSQLKLSIFSLNTKPLYSEHRAIR